MGDEQHTLFDWLRAKASPRGAISKSGIDDVDDEAVRRLHRQLESALGTVDLVVTNNRRRMVTARRNGKRHELRIHRMFVDAPAETVSALVGLARGHGDEREELRRFIRENRDEIKHAPKPSKLRQAGTVHDLEASMRRAIALLDEDGFDDVSITWGRRGRGTRSIRFGSYDFEQRLIRIHPALDEDWVPENFVDFVVYHELLHVVVPPIVDEAGNRNLHPPEFREREQRFPHYEEAVAWERRNLDRLMKR